MNKSAAPCIDFLYIKGTAKGSEKKLCGVFIAPTDARKAFDLEVYSEFHMNPFAFSPASRERRTSGQSMQDRLGLHTFRRGDVVVYTLAEPHEEMSMMCVWGLCDEPAKLSSDDSAKVQARKVLVLYDFAAKIFFVGAWPAWRRVPDPAKVSSDGESFHCDKDDQVKVINRDQCEEMARQWSQLPPHALLGSLAKMQKDAQKPPPSLEVARKREHREQKEREQNDAREQKEREKKERKKREMEKKEREKGGKGGVPSRLLLSRLREISTTRHRRVHLRARAIRHTRPPPKGTLTAASRRLLTPPAGLQPQPPPLCASRAREHSGHAGSADGGAHGSARTGH